MAFLMCLEAGQGAVDLPHDVIARQTGVVGPVADAAGHLRGDHEVVAVPPEYARQNLLRRAAGLVHVPKAVDVGAVDEVDPQLDGPLDGALGLIGVLLAAQAQAVGQTRHLQAGTAELDVFHALLL